MPKVTLMSRLTYDSTIQVGSIQVGEVMYPNNVIIPARGKVSMTVINPDAIILPKGVIKLGGAK